MFFYSVVIYITVSNFGNTFLISVARSRCKFGFMTFFDGVIHKFPFSFYCCISWVA